MAKDEQAFNVMEGAGFKNLINELQPIFVVPSRMTITRDIYALFCNEKSNLMKELTAPGQKVSLTTNVGHTEPKCPICASLRTTSILIGRWKKG